MTQKIITITREYGSGGRLIAKKVAEALNIAFYDNELIDETARQLGIDIDTIRKASQENHQVLLIHLIMVLLFYQLMTKFMLHKPKSLNILLKKKIVLLLMDVQTIF